MQTNTKEWWQYSVSTVGFFSGIVMCYLAFFVINAMANFSLFYLGQMIAFCAAVYGIGLYINHKTGEYASKQKERNEERFNQLEEKIDRIVDKE